MTWTQLQDLAANGNEVAAHTLTGQNLTLLTPDQQRQEICRDDSARRSIRDANAARHSQYSLRASPTIQK
jgi:hypothetical protein